MERWSGGVVEWWSGGVLAWLGECGHNSPIEVGRVSPSAPSIEFVAGAGAKTTANRKT